MNTVTTVTLDKDFDCTFTFKNGDVVKLQSDDRNLSWGASVDFARACRAVGLPFTTVQHCFDNRCACVSHPSFVADTESVDHVKTWNY